MQPGLHEELARLTALGDRWAWWELCNQYHNFLRGLAGKFSTRTKSMTFDDLFQESKLVLLQLARSYQPDNGTKFSTWLIGYGGNALQRVIDGQDRIVYTPTTKTLEHRNTVRSGGDSFLPTTVDAEAVPEDVLSGGMGDPEGSTSYRQTLLAEVMQYIDCLEPREQIIIKRHLFDEDSMKEIGRDLGTSHQTCINVYIRAIKKLRGWMNVKLDEAPTIWRYGRDTSD